MDKAQVQILVQVFELLKTVKYDSMDTDTVVLAGTTLVQFQQLIQAELDVIAKEEQEGAANELED